LLLLVDVGVAGFVATSLPPANVLG
jgi:hypothetical protein